MFSIIMPTYNRAAVIARAIRSVLSQTYQDFELIIVDDGSSDNTEAVVRSFKDKRIIYHHYDGNCGANHARNVGMEISKGGIIAFLDSDNEWYPGYLELQKNALEKEGTDISFCKYERLYEKNEAKIIPRIDAQSLAMSEIVERMVQGNIMDTNVTCIKRKCYLECGGFDEGLKRYQDWDYFLTLIEHGFMVGYTNSVQSRNYTMRDSISLRDEYRDEAFTHIFGKHIDFYMKRKRLGAFISGMIDCMGDEYFPHLENELRMTVCERISHGGVRNIVLYGYGSRGKIFYRLACGTERISAVVDKYLSNPEDAGVEIFNDITEIQNIGCVVVTVKKDNEKIMQELAGLARCPVYDVSRFIDKMLA